MQLADKAGVPLTTLRNWEHDRREPLVSALFKLARALGVDCSAFQTEDAQATPKQPAAKKTTRKQKG
jgi:transcriptional regulator with XRE-family HTH domain